MSKRVCVVVLVMIFALTCVYAGILDRIQKAWANHDLDKVEKLTLKSLEKDTLNPGARYYLSLLFLDSAYQRSDIDSASYFIETAIEDFYRASPELLADLSDSQLTLEVFQDQKTLVGDAAFSRAEQLMLIPALEDFMERFAYSRNVPKAIALRDSLAYEHAKDQHSWQAYEKYFNDYPRSAYVGEAKERYQLLIFKEYIQDDKLESYERFLEDHPTTPYRQEVEAVIFERSTRDNQKLSYLAFAKRYPRSHFAKKAADIVYYLNNNAREIQPEVRGIHPNPDSLSTLHSLNSLSLFPTFENNRFGWMSTAGNEVLKPTYEQISEAYLCGNVKESWLEVVINGKKSLINRTGQVLATGIAGYRPISPAIKLITWDQTYLYHASGFLVMDEEVDDARELDNGWIAYKHNYLWGLVSPSGAQIIKPSYQAIDQVGPFIIVESDERYAISTVASLAHSDAPNLEFIYDDYELVQDTLLQVFNGEEEAVLDENLEFIVPMDKQEVYINGQFWYIKNIAGYKMIDEETSRISDQSFEDIEVNEGWLAIREPEEWLLISRETNGVKPQNRIDSVKLLTDYATYIEKGDSVGILFQGGSFVQLSADQQVNILTRSGATMRSSFLMLAGKTNSSVWNRHGHMLFDGRFEAVTLMTDSLFKIKVRGKTGLKRSDGSDMISARYDVIDEQNSLIFLLKDGKIGCYDLSNNALIPAEYTARISKVGKYYQVAEDGLFGLVNEVNKALFPAEYDEIMAWNDTSIWVRTTTRWQLISFEGDVFLDNIQSVNLWFQTNGQQLALIIGEGGTGLYGNRSGEILAPQYNEIINVGNEAQPVFFAEQHLKAAAFFVVTYFNLNGTTIKSQAFRPEEYDRIYCDQ